MLRRVVLLLLLAGCAGRRPGSPPSNPEEAIDDVLAADRAFATASARTNVVAGLSPMFSESALMPIPGNRFAVGKEQIVEALRANPLNARSRLEWLPVRAGVSADGLHGFTLGYMTLYMPDSAPAPLKYLAYWVKEPAGWRVAVYRRRRHNQPPVNVDAMDPAIPKRLVQPTRNASIINMYRASLDRAERLFSDSAQKIGLGKAFEIFGSADAINLGGPEARDFIVGSQAIGRSIAAGSPPTGSPVTWAPDRVLVSSSGDLGVTIGYLRPNGAPAGEPIPFFTIWRRATPADRWLYVAE